MEGVFTMIKVNKYYFAWHEKEEKAFLEEMSLKGYRLCKLGIFKYYFEECEPENRIYEADFRTFDKMSKEEYLQLYLDSGWEFDAQISGWYMFSRINDGVHTSLFNDKPTLKQKYKRLLMFLGLLGLPVYYYALIILPNLESELSGFYSIFRLFYTILVPIHLFALVRIYFLYRKFD